jgi:hypothetical protein
MDFSPSRQEVFLLFGDEFHCAPYVISLHAFGPYQFRTTIPTDQVDLELAVTKDMDVRRLMTIQKNDDTQAVRAIDRDHNFK